MYYASSIIIIVVMLSIPVAVGSGRCEKERNSFCFHFGFSEFFISIHQKKERKKIERNSRKENYVKLRAVQSLPVSSSRKHGTVEIILHAYNIIGKIPSTRNTSTRRYHVAIV